ncbi:ankyrin repeat-containing protein [Trifolium repens]|nr:ankyrin repeat-containing protein [Trifolium repens]
MSMQNDVGETLLYIAAENGVKDLFRFLLSFCDLEILKIRSKSDMKAFHVAAKRGHLEMEEMIMKHNFTITKTLIAGSDQDPTKIYEGTHGDPKDGVSWGKREAAIKRIPKADREKAIIQTRAYMELDQMLKILRCFGAMEYKDFCYIILERAGCNLSKFTMLSHPLLWDKTKRVHFLCELNNIVGTWKCRFHSDFMAEVNTWNNSFKYGRFEVKELQQFVKNMFQHFDDYQDYLGSSMDSAYEYVVDGITQLIVIGYDIVKRRNHKGTDRFKRFFCS